jgi:hypothetical protein
MVAPILDLSVATNSSEIADAGVRRSSSIRDSAPSDDDADADDGKARIVL